MNKKYTTIQHTREYTAVLEPAEEGGYVVHIPALPGCATQGETVEEALFLAQDAIKGYLAVMKEIVGVSPEEPQGAIIAKVPIAV